MGAQVIALDVSLERRKLAREFGVNEVIDARSNNPVEAIRELTHGEGARARALPGSFEPFYPPARLTTREKGKHLMHKRYWLDYDPAAFAVLVIGMGMIELLASSI